MAKKLLQGKKGKWILGIFIFFVSLFVIAFFSLGYVVKNLLLKQAKQQTNGAYQLAISNFDLDIFSGNVKAEGLTFLPDTSTIRSSPSFQDLYRVTAPEINIKGIDLWKILFHNTISIDRLEIVKPDVTWLRNFDPKPIQSKRDSTTTADNKAKSGKKLPPVHIGLIHLSESTIKIKKKDSLNSLLLSIDKASLRVDQFVFSSPQDSLSMKQFNYDNFTFFVKDYSMKLPDSLYVFHFDSLKASVNTSSLLLNGIKLTPRYEQYEFGKKKGEQTDRIELYTKALLVSGIDFRSLKENNQFIAGGINVDSINMYVFRDKRNNLPDNKVVKLPQQQLRELPYYIDIDSVTINNTQITYQERVEGAAQPGTLNFINLNGTLKNITNDSAKLREGSP